MIAENFQKYCLLALSASAFSLLSACGGSSGSSTTTTSNGNVNNVQAIAVDGGPVAGQIYPDGAFTSVNVCVPGTSNCQTVPGILVDTGSFGLRILASAVSSLNLPAVPGTPGNNLYNCVSFIDGSFLWGTVAQADIKMASEVASSSSIQLIGDPSGFTIPSACSNGGVNIDNQQALGANGILGVGPEPDDCGPACASGSGSAPPVYFSCATTGNCQTAFVSEGQQVVNPIVRFAKDNNGVVLELQSVDVASATATGSMVFGIGTQSNNALGSAKVFTLNNFGNFTTNFNQQTLSESFIDSGSNGLFFPDSDVASCASNTIAPDFFCPAATVNLTAQTVGSNAAQNSVSFSIDNAVNTFQANPSDAAFSELGGPNGSGSCSAQNQGACSFDWGLPFFYGRSVFSAIDGQTVPSGAPAAPWWAY